MKQLKQKLETLTLRYIELFPDEYKAVVTQLAAEREKNKDKFASVYKDKVLRRKIYEIPETLHKMWVKELSEEELVALKDGPRGQDISHWFAKRFPEFAGGTTV